ncbi:50S ribosomal protein L25 [Pseudodesulfovibrio tunisiensis]|uniref:50S ribosomal protein L25 n=1 Tax=Pseudodesulfovibrio tunisiensis TaxID=463192 RepID=UPI001FB32A08|nr:50S ribosomal protein L25 [Pseudodesulfovibrio tunisiensis]
MANKIQLKAAERTETGKGANRRLRRTGMVPGVFYNQQGDNVTVMTSLVPLQKAYSQLGNSQVFDLELEKDGKTQTIPSLLWRVKFDPVKPMPIHVDFFGVDLEKELKVTVPLQVKGVSKGVKLGGRMEQFREVVEIVSKPADIPEAIVIDVTEMDILDTVRVADLTFPEGVTPMYDDNFAIVSVLPKRGDAEDEEETEEEAAE